MNKERWWLLSGGIVIGLIAVVLVKYGNPPNMGFCIACFERDIAGALGLHRAAVVQYMRPEIIGLVLGALIIAMIKGEFKPRGGSSTFLRFIMGIFMMVGALVFLGCPLRDVLRMAGGDFNAIVGFGGFICGIGTGVFFLRKGFDLERSTMEKKPVGAYILPAIMLLFLGLLLAHVVISPEAGGPLFFSKDGPGSKAAPIIMSLAAGLAVGVIAQRIRLCLSGGIRDFLLIKDYTLLLGFVGIFAGALILNLVFGFFKPAWVGQPIAHMDHIWNFLGLYLVGLTACLLGGCPLRQLILSGEGDTDAAAVVMGMIIGAAFCHNFMFAASTSGVGIYGQIACVVGILFMFVVGWVNREA